MEPSEHPLKKAKDRMLAYSKRVASAVAEHELSTSSRALSVDISAANRFIEHAVPDLSAEQKRQLKQVQCQKRPL
eukprot:scaffold88337_cov41-Prasinocladus_malaysianus.AAC.1